MSLLLLPFKGVEPPRDLQEDLEDFFGARNGWMKYVSRMSSKGAHPPGDYSYPPPLSANSASANAPHHSARAGDPAPHDGITNEARTACWAPLGTQNVEGADIRPVDWSY